MGLAAVDTLGIVARSKGTKRLPPELVAKIARELDEIIKTRFDDNQTRAAKQLGISQSHLSKLTSAEAKRGEPVSGPGLYTLLKMREITDRSLDDLLGLTLPSDLSASALEASIERTRMERAAERAERAAERIERAVQGEPTPEGEKLVTRGPRRSKRWNPVGVEKYLQQAQGVRDRARAAKRPKKDKGVA